MCSAALKYLRFSIGPVEGGWSWVVRDPEGRETARGLVRERAVAAALVLREIARVSMPAQDA